MRSILMLCTVMAILNRSYACNAHEMVHHEMQMQHGFVLSDEDRFASHLVASGHHS